MAKLPPDTPERGERVARRGRESQTGVLLTYDPETNWARVKWDSHGPKYCHRTELKRIA